MRCGLLCIKCNLTTHTKYTSSESDPKFNPNINLRCPERIIIFSNGLIHMLNVRLDQHKPPKICSNSLDISYINNCDRNSFAVNAIDCKGDDDSKKIVTEEKTAGSGATKKGCEIKTKSSVDIVAQIIADFAECETAEHPSQDIIKKVDEYDKWLPKKYFEELQVICGGATSTFATGSICNSTTSTHTTTNSSSATVVPSTSSNRLRLLSYRPSRTMTTTNMIEATISSSPPTFSPSTSPGKMATDKAAANAYEFSEDSDKYEKISIFRKRRLADKKYEFSEDNAENIIPFTKLRLRSGNGDSKRPKFLQSSGGGHCSSALIVGSASSSSVCTSTSSSSDHLLQHTHRASPSHGFRSPCGSPVGNRFMSPPGGTTRTAYGKSPTYIKPYASPRSTQFNSKRTIYELSDSLMLSSGGGSNSMLLLSPRGGNDDFEIFRCQQLPSVVNGGGGNGTQPLSEVKPSNIDTSTASLNVVTTSTASTTVATEKTSAKDDEKPMCSKKLARRFVEEDDSTSVITSEEGKIVSEDYNTSRIY